MPLIGLRPGRAQLRFASRLLLALAAAGGAASNGSHVDASAAKLDVPVIERPGVWQPPAGGVQVPLWPADVALAKPDTGDHPEATGNGSPLVAGRPWHWASYVTRPTMTIFRPKGRNSGTALLVLPGGGFRAVATDLEGTEICQWAVRQAMTCAMLKYRTPQLWGGANGRGRRPQVLLALDDAQRALGLLRLHAAAYGIDPRRIGVIGFSAGAFLATDLSNTGKRGYPPADAADRLSPRPDFAIIAYTARVLDPGRQKDALVLAPWVKISVDAPPTLILHAMNDPIDDVRQAMAYALALNDAGVPVDMRLYARGGHAFGLRRTADPVTREWPDHVIQWLRDIGEL